MRVSKARRKFDTYIFLLDDQVVRFSFKKLGREERKRPLMNYLIN